MSVTQRSECEVGYLDANETESLLETLAQRKMGISIAEFRKRANRGEYAGVDWDSVPGLVDVALMAGLR